MKYSLTAYLLFVVLAVQAQQRPEVEPVPTQILDKIKSDVWIPFMQSYRDLDSDKIKSIHSPDIVRITIDNNKVETGQDYLDNFGGFLESVKSRGGQLGIAFSLRSTAINQSEDVAYQTGYYRFSSKREGENDLQVRGYGHFNVALRKEGGVWKLTLDSDKRVPIDAEEFNSGTVYTLN